jgi:hypothetical protein
VLSGLKKAGDPKLARPLYRHNIWGFNTACFTNATALGRIGNTPRNSVRMPAMFNTDLETLAIAYYFKGDEAYAAKATELLRALSFSIPRRG